MDSQSNLTRYTTPNLTPPTLLATLTSSFFSDQISAISKTCYYHITHLRCIMPSYSPQLAPIATSIIHSKLDYCNSLYCSLPHLRLPASNRFRTLSPVQLLELLNPVTSLLSHALFTRSKQPNASNTNSSYSLTKSSQPPNHHICIKICSLSSQHSLFISDFIYLYTFIASLAST